MNAPQILHLKLLINSDKQTFLIFCLVSGMVKGPRKRDSLLAATWMVTYCLDVGFPIHKMKDLSQHTKALPWPPSALKFSVYNIFNLS